MRWFGCLFRRREPTIEISNALVTSLWDSTPVRVPAKLDVEAFLKQDKLPYLWKGEKYKSYIDRQDNPQQLLRFHWVSALLFHPDPAIVALLSNLRLRSPAS